MANVINIYREINESFRKMFGTGAVVIRATAEGDTHKFDIKIANKHITEEEVCTIKDIVLEHFPNITFKPLRKE